MDGTIIGKPEAIGVSRKALEATIKLLEEQRQANLHDGAQLFVARKGVPVLDVAIGEARPGLPMRTDSIMLWFSSTKPLTAIAIARLMEKGQLSLDDKVRKYIPGFGNGKENATIKHVLIHMGGFPMNMFPFHRYGWEDNIRYISESPAEWEPGTAAGYHAHSGWCVLGEVVRVADGRPIEKYLYEDVFQPLGMKDTTLGLTQERMESVKDRLSNVVDKAIPNPPPHFRNDPQARARVLPGGNGFGPAHDLAKFYLMMWNSGEWNGKRIIKKETHELFTAVHRRDIIDRTFSALWGREVKPVWALGMHKGTDGNIRTDMGRLCTSAAYGHGGNLSSIGFVEPTRDLVVVIITNGQPPGPENTRRLCAISDLLHEACS